MTKILKFSCTVGSEPISVNFSHCVPFKSSGLSCSLTLFMHVYDLESIGLQNCINFSEVGTFCDTICKKSPVIPSEKSSSIENTVTFLASLSVWWWGQQWCHVQLALLPCVTRRCYQFMHLCLYISQMSVQWKSPATFQHAYKTVLMPWLSWQALEQPHIPWVT